MEEPRTPAPNENLKKSFNSMNVWAIALGSIIGFGCFILPPDFLEKSGPMGVFLGLLIGALAMLLVGKNIGFLVEKFPEAGGQFTFAYNIFGKRSGYICGWMLSLCFISLISMNATALGVLAQHLAPAFFTKGYLFTVAGWDVYVPQIILSLFFIIVFGVFNYRGGEVAGNLQLGMVGLMICSVVLILIGTILSPNASASNLSPGFPDGVSPMKAIGSMVALAPWLYVGFDTIPHAAEEFKFSSKKTFLLVAASIVIGGVIYLIVTLCTGMVWPWEAMVSARYTWATGEAMENSIGRAGVIFLAVAICMGIFTGMNGFYLASTRLLLSMSRTKILPPIFGRIHPKHQTPSAAIVIVMIISLIAPFFGRTAIGWVVDMCSCSTAIAYLYTCLGTWKVLKEEKAKSGKASMASWIPVGGAICSLAILLLLIIPGSPGAMGKESWIVLVVWALIGVAFYFTAGRSGARD